MPTDNVNYGCNGYFYAKRDDGKEFELVGYVEGVEYGDMYCKRTEIETYEATVRLRVNPRATAIRTGRATPLRVIRNGPATIVFWKDGTKTVVKCHDEDYDPEKGLAMALCRKLWGRCQTERFVRMVEEQEAR